MIEGGMEANSLSLVYRKPDAYFDAGEMHFFPFPFESITLPVDRPVSQNARLDKSQLGGSDVQSIDVRSQTSVGLLGAIRAVFG